MLLLSACLEEADGRFAAQQSVGTRTIDDSHFEITIDPGRRPDLADDSRILLQASAPTPRLVFEQRRTAARSIAVNLSNVFTDIVLVPTLTTLSDVGECPARDDVQTIVAAAQPGIPVGPGTHELPLLIPGCTRLSYQVAPTGRMGTAREIRIAIIGENRGNREVLTRILNRIEELDAAGTWSADFVMALGNLANSDQLVDLQGWWDDVSESELPVVVTIGDDEVTRGGGLVPFHEQFGRSDYTFAIGEIRFLMFDTASADFSEGQFAYWRDVMDVTPEPVRLAFMQTPPFDPAQVRDAGFNSRNQAARFLSLLGEGSVDVVFTGGVGTYVEELRLATIPFFHTGGGGRPMEALSDGEHHFLRVTLNPSGVACRREDPPSCAIVVVEVEEVGG